MAHRKLAIAFSLMGTVLAPTAYALGLGAAETKSALNQPLDARIPLLSVEPGELESLVVNLASPAAFERAGLDRPFALSKLKFTVVRGDKPYIQVTTQQPVKEPFLGFLVEANWSRGRLVREFTLLLDPPVYASGPTVAPAARPSAAQPSEQPAASSRPVATTATAGGGVGGGTPGEYGPVKSSDTLWKVAQRVRPDGSVSVHQTMVALLRANPDAFISGDMNRLKRGSVLRVPAASSIAQISQSEAVAEVNSQIARWRSESASTPVAPAAPASDARLKVVAPSERGGEQAASSVADRGQLSPSQLQRELALNEEAIANLKSENEELKAQVEALRQEMANLHRMVNVQGQPSLPGQTTAAPTEPQSVTPPATTDQPAPQGDQTAAPAATDTQPQPAVEAKPKPAPVEPAPKPGFLDDWKNQGMLAGLGLILLALVYLIIRRRSAAPAERAAAPQVQPEMVASAPVADLPEDSEPEEMESRPALRQDMPLDSDALSEAEVYLAYGRYDQAQDVIGKALAQEPDRTDLRLKMLEILALAQDTTGFENHAAQLRDQVGTSDPAWQRAAEMGRDLIPGSALFADGESMAAEPTLDEPLLDAPVAAPEEDSGLDFGDLKLDADAEPELGGQAEEPAGELSMDFDLGESQAEEPELAAEPATDFNLDLDSSFEPADAAPLVDDLAAAEPEPEMEPVAETANDVGLEFDLGAFDSAPAAPAMDADTALAEAGDDVALDTLDEVSTKLDLARAYLDMGDNEGARSLLGEVLEEGNAKQKRVAEELMAKIA